MAVLVAKWLFFRSIYGGMKEVFDVSLSREINPLWEENTLMLSKKKSREKEVLDVFLSREINPLWAPPLLGMVYENLLALFGLY